RFRRGPGGPVTPTVPSAPSTRRPGCSVRPAVFSDEGSVLPLLAAFVAIALALILTVAAAGSLYLERKRLLTVADGAALAAAESFDLAQAAIGPGSVEPRLDLVTARAAAADFLADDPDPRTRDIALRAVRIDDGRSVTVVLTSVWSPPVLTPFLPDGIALEASSTARSVFR
ncbi:MAG: pilus assembly protein TadG-related protein, partial [Naasia sp.]